MPAVTFDYGTWILRYSELQSVPIGLAQLYFNEAGLYCDNTSASLVVDENVRSMLLGMLVAHIAKLNAPIDGKKSEHIVGRLNGATEGSVTVGIENSYPPGSAQWYQQTKYGAAYWEATAQYRTFRYQPSVARDQDVYARLVNFSL